MTAQTAAKPAGAKAANGAEDDNKRKKKKKQKITNRDILIFTKKLSTLLSSGLPIMRTLRMLETQSENPAMQEVVSEIYTDIESGANLSEAFEKHDHVFDIIYINLMRAGEASGRLTVFLERLIVQIEKAEKIRAKVKKALMYPIILMCVAAGVILIMLIKVVPVFQNMFKSMGAELPGPTQMLINMSEFLRDPARGGLLLMAVVGAVWVVKLQLKKNPAFKKKWDRGILKLPVLGNIITNSVLAKIAMIQSNLSSAGVSVLESLEIIKKTMNNTIYREAVEEVRAGVAIGTPLSEQYEARGDVFPPAFCQMVEVGEETGNVDEMLDSTAAYYEEEFDMSVDRMTELMEPIMIVSMGLTVGFIIVAMYMPIFQVGSMMSG